MLIRAGMTYYIAEDILLLHVSQQYSFLSEGRDSACTAVSEEMHNAILDYWTYLQAYSLTNVRIYSGLGACLFFFFFLPLVELCSKLWGIWHILMNEDRVQESFPAIEITHLIRTLIKNKYSSSIKVWYWSFECLRLKLVTVNIVVIFRKHTNCLE